MGYVSPFQSSSTPSTTPLAGGATGYVSPFGASSISTPTPASTPTQGLTPVVGKPITLKTTQQPVTFTKQVLSGLTFTSVKPSAKPPVQAPTLNAPQTPNLNINQGASSATMNFQAPKPITKVQTPVVGKPLSQTSGVPLPQVQPNLSTPQTTSAKMTVTPQSLQKQGQDIANLTKTTSSITDFLNSFVTQEKTAMHNFSPTGAPITASQLPPRSEYMSNAAYQQALKDVGYVAKPNTSLPPKPVAPTKGFTTQQQVDQFNKQVNVYNAAIKTAQKNIDQYNATIKGGVKYGTETQISRDLALAIAKPIETATFGIIKADNIPQNQQESIIANIASVAPLALIPAATLVKFVAINAVVNKVFQTVTGKQQISDLLPADAPAWQAKGIGILELLAEGYLAHGIKLGSLTDKFTKTTVQDYNLPQTFSITGKQLFDIHQTGTLTTAEEKQFVRDLYKGDPTGYSNAIKDAATKGKGVQVNVPASTVVSMVDKPYWVKVKSIFGQSASEPINVSTTVHGKTTQSIPIAGLLTPGEHTPQDVINTVFTNKAETTPEGKAIIAAAAKIQTQGNNINITKAATIADVNHPTPTTNYYRGISQARDPLSISNDQAASYGAGVYMFENPTPAKAFNDNVATINPNKNLNLYTPTEQQRVQITNLSGTAKTDYIKSLIGNTYDGLRIVKPDYQGTAGAPEIVVYDKSLLNATPNPIPAHLQVIRDQLKAANEPELLNIANMLAKNLQNPSILVKMNGRDVTEIRNLFYATTLDEFSSHIDILAARYGGDFTQIASAIKSGIINEQTYGQFQINLEQENSNIQNSIHKVTQSSNTEGNTIPQAPGAEGGNAIQGGANEGSVIGNQTGNVNAGNGEASKPIIGSEPTNGITSRGSNTESSNASNSIQRPVEPQTDVLSLEPTRTEPLDITKKDLVDILTGKKQLSDWKNYSGGNLFTKISTQDFVNLPENIRTNRMFSNKNKFPVVGTGDKNLPPELVKRLVTLRDQAIELAKSGKFELKKTPKGFDVNIENGVTASFIDERPKENSPDSVIGKTQIKELITYNSEFRNNPILTVNENKSLVFDGATSHFSIEASALGLQSENLKVGDKIRVDEKTLTGTQQQMRVYSPSGAYASRGSSPIGAFEKVPEGQSEASNFKLFKEVQGLIDKYAQSIGEGYLPRGTAGVFHTATKNIRIDGMNDLSVAAHEITHFLDQKGKISNSIMEEMGRSERGMPIYDSKTLNLRKDMTKLYQKYYPTGRADHALKTRMVEGYATLLQKYVEMPTTIAQEFPNLVKTFLQPEGKFYQPVIGEIIDDLRGIVDKYQGLDALDKIGARVTSDKNPVVKDSHFNFRDNLRNTFVDGIWNQEKLNQLAGTGRTNEDFSLWMRMAPNYSAVFGNNIIGKKGYFAYRDGEFVKVHDQNWSDLIKTLDKEKQLDSFGYYLVARDQYFNWQTLDQLEQTYNAVKDVVPALISRLADMNLEKELYQPEDFIEIQQKIKSAQASLDEARRNFEDQGNILKNNGFTRQEVEQAYLENKDRWPEQEKLFDTLVHESLQFAAHPDVQLIKPEQFKELSGKQGYASMKRQIYDELVGDKEGGGQVSIGGTRISSMIQRKGGSNTIINPLYNALTNESEILKKGLQQIVYNKIGEIAHKAIFPDLFQPQQLRAAVESNGRISFPQEKDPNIIMSRKDFKRDPILVDAKEKKMIDDLMTYQQLHLIDQILISANRFFTHGTTALYTQFALTTFIKHQIDATAQSQNGYIPLVSPLKTLTSILAKQGSQEAVWGLEYMTLGGVRQTLAGWQDQSPSELMKSITQEKNGILKVIDLMDKGMNILAVPAKYTEVVTRMGEYIASRQRGNPQIVALEDAGRVTAPFHHIGNLGGNRGKAFVRSIPFFNADLQYMDQALRSLANPKTRSRYLFTTIVVTAAIIAAGQLLVKFGSKQQKQTYTDLQANDLARYLWLPAPDGTTLIKFPIPQQMTLVGTLLNMLIFQMTQHANYQTGDFIQGAGAILPNPLNVTNFGRFLTTYVPQIIKPALETAMNVKDYPTFLPLVPTALQGLPPSQQFNKGTSPVAKWMGTTFNLSPIKVDYLLTGYFGRASGYLTGKPSNLNPAQGVTQTQYFAGGRTVQNFYNSKLTNDQNFSAMRKSLVSFTPQQRTQIIQNHSKDLQIGKLLTEYRKVDLVNNTARAAKLQDLILNLMSKRQQ